MSNKPLIDRVIGGNSRGLDQNLTNKYSTGEIVKEVALRVGVAVIAVGGVCAAVEIARHYHLAEYIRRFF